MRILVFGKSGQVASALARQKSGKHTIVCVGRPEGDILDQGNLNRHVAEQRPDLVVNAAAYTAVDLAESNLEAAFCVNRDGARNVALACASSNIPLVHVSTDYVFSGEQSSPYTPDSETNPQNVYGQSKLAGEKAVAEVHDKHIILRTAWVYDITGSNFPKTMLRLAESRDELTVVGNQYGNPSDAAEIANAIMAVADTIGETGRFTQWGTYHFAGSERFSWADFARLIMATSRLHGGPHAIVRDISDTEYPTAAKRPSYSLLDAATFAETFGYESIPVSASIERAMPFWLRKNQS